MHGLPVMGTKHLVNSVMLSLCSNRVLKALGLAALGPRIARLGFVGDDPFGRSRLARLDAAGIDSTGSRGRRGCDEADRRWCHPLWPHDRAVVIFPGAIAHGGIMHVRFDVLRRCRSMYLPSYFLQEALRPTAVIVVHPRRRPDDLGGHGPRLKRAVGYRGLLDHVDLFLPSETEACTFVGTPDDEAALRWLSIRVFNAGMDRRLARGRGSGWLRRTS